MGSSITLAYTKDDRDRIVAVPKKDLTDNHKKLIRLDGSDTTIGDMIAGNIIRDYEDFYYEVVEEEPYDYRLRLVGDVILSEYYLNRGYNMMKIIREMEKNKGDKNDSKNNK